MALEWIEQPPAAPERPDDAHKGTFGTVIVIGGSRTMIGAPALCAASALRAGVGLCKLAMPAPLLLHAITIEPSTTGIALDIEAGDGMEVIDEQDSKGNAVLAVGPGLGQSASVRRMIEQVLRSDRKIVLDADGLNGLAKLDVPPPGKPGRQLVLTPHPGEFKRLAESADIKLNGTDPDQRPEAAAALAKRFNAVTVLKGNATIVSDGQRAYRNTTGNPALATAGSGDVLTGLIASLMAQGLDAFDAACLATHLHGLAADTWTDSYGPSGLTAMTLAEMIPAAMHLYRGGA